VSLRLILRGGHVARRWVRSYQIGASPKFRMDVCGSSFPSFSPCDTSRAFDFLTVPRGRLIPSIKRPTAGGDDVAFISYPIASSLSLTLERLGAVRRWPRFWAFSGVRVHDRVCMQWARFTEVLFDMIRQAAGRCALPPAHTRFGHHRSSVQTASVCLGGFCVQ